MSKQITIPVPDGKRAEWINGVLTLVDEKDNRPITERVKTFEDACRELGDEHQFVKEYWVVYNSDISKISTDILSYLRLRIIVAALNEGWEPQFTTGEYRYFPWFYLYTKEEYDKLDDEKKGVVRFAPAATRTRTTASCSALRITVLRSHTPTMVRGLPSELVNSQPTMAFLSVTGANGSKTTTFHNQWQSFTSLRSVIDT